MINMKKLISFFVILTLSLHISAYANSSSLEFLKQAASSAPGNSQSDWAAIALMVSGKTFDKDGYINGLTDYVTAQYKTEYKLSKNKSTEWHRIAIAVNLAGEDALNFAGVNLINDGVFYRENLGKQGLNGYIWALITLSSGNFTQPGDAINTKDSIITYILSKQNEDGSFSLSGSTPSVDITAMALYSLSFYKERTDVSKAINNGLSFLSSVQNEDGSFSENGVPNTESTAQVIIALSALSINTSDSYFPKLYDALMSFKTPDGFCHIKGGSTDVIATYQAVCTLKALEYNCAVYSNFLSWESEIVEVESECATIDLVAEPISEHSTEAYSEKQTEPKVSAKINNPDNVNVGITIVVAIVALCVIIILIRRKAR